MLKKRIVACLPLHNGVVVQSIGFQRYLPVGKPLVALEYLNKWGIDEIILIDITARKNRSPINFEMYRGASQRCQVPLTIGGGIQTLEHVENLMHCGADKVSLNRVLFENSTFITEVAKAYGNQCVVVSLDVVKIGNQYKIYNYLTKHVEALSPADAAKKAVSLGAGEVFVNSVDRDGTYTGYDVDLINQICAAVKVPVIAAGGARNASDMVRLLKQTNVSAACAGNFFHFTENSVNIAKQFMLSAGVDLRLETYADYAENGINEDHRLCKKDDTVLDHLFYLKIEKEII